MDRSKSSPSWGFFFREFKLQTITLVVLFILSGVAESLGAVSIVPLLSSILGQDSAQSPLVERLNGYFVAVGIEPSLEALLVVICLAIALKALLTFLAFRKAGYIEADVVVWLRMKLFDRLLKAHWPYYVSLSTGKLTHGLSLEAKQSGTSFRVLCQGLSYIVQAFAYLAAGILVSWELLVAGLMGGVVFYLIFRSVIQLVRRAGFRQAAAVNAIASTFTDSLAGAKPIKVMGAEESFVSYIDMQTGRFRAAARQYALGNSFLTSFQEPALVVILCLGIYIATESMGIASATLLGMAFFFHKILSRFSSFQQSLEQYASLEGGLVSLLKKIEDTEGHQEDNPGNERVILEREVRLSGVALSYGSKMILSDVDIALPVGTITALCGPSGSGKTSVADMVAGLVSPDQGLVSVDSVDLAEMDMHHWRNQIGYVPQEVFLFHDTIRKNITLGREHTDEEIWEAVDRAGAREFVQRTENGLDMIVGEHGRNLSGGQRQRLMIARALISRPRLLILDEATTGLDGDTEQAILVSVAKIKKDMAVLVISHQAAVKKVSDFIYTFDGTGRLDMVSNVSGLQTGGGGS